MEEISCFPLVMKELPEEFMKKAETELGETPERLEKSIVELRKLILEEKDLSIRIDDEFLIMFLRPRKLDCDRAFTTIKKLFKFKLELDFFLRIQNINPFYDILERRIVAFLQYRDPKGRAVFVFKIRNWNLDGETLDDIIAVVIGLLYTILEFPMTQVNGIVAIIDLKNISLNHLTHITPRNIQHIAHGLQECSPFRFEGAHIVKETVLFKYIWMLIKPLLKMKLRNRCFFHGKNMESLHQFIPASILPPEYGGNLDIPSIGEQCKETMYGEKCFLDLKNSGYMKEERRLRNELKEKVKLAI